MSSKVLTCQRWSCVFFFSCTACPIYMFSSGTLQLCGCPMSSSERWRLKEKYLLRNSKTWVQRESSVLRTWPCWSKDILVSFLAIFPSNTSKGLPADHALDLLSSSSVLICMLLLVLDRLARHGSRWTRCSGGINKRSSGQIYVDVWYGTKSSNIKSKT